MVTKHPREHLAELMEQFSVVTLPYDDPELDGLVRAYRDRWNLGSRQSLNERAQAWRGVRYENRTVAVVGERVEGGNLELTDAYREESHVGLAAYAMMAYGYLALARNGTYAALIHTCLFENVEQWKSIMAETGDQPYALIFIHRKKL